MNAVRNEDHTGCVADPDATDLAARCECGGWRVLETLGEWAAQASVPELAHALGQAEARAEYWQAAAEANHEQAELYRHQRDEDEQYAPPVAFPRTGNAWTDYVNDARVRNGVAPLLTEAQAQAALDAEDAAYKEGTRRYGWRS